MFLAAIDRSEFSPWRWEIYLVNIDKKYHKLRQIQGSLSGDDDSVIDLGHGLVKTFNLPNGSYELIDVLNDVGEYDFVTWYSFEDIESGEKFDFTLRKYLPAYRPYWKKKLPILNQPGCLIEEDEPVL